MHRSGSSPPRHSRRALGARVAVGLGAGAAIAAVDNFAAGGEVSPIVIVLLLLVATATVGRMWGRGAWAATVAVWVCVPLAHVVKHVFGLPDTLHPNTYRSILMLAAFTGVVAALGTGAGVLLHRRGRLGGAARLPEAPDARGQPPISRS